MEKLLKIRSDVSDRWKNNFNFSDTVFPRTQLE